MAGPWSRKNLITKKMRTLRPVDSCKEENWKEMKSEAESFPSHSSGQE